MRTTQPVRAPDDGGAPVWTRARRKSGNPVMGFIGAVLILFALLIILLTALNGGSFGKGGAQVDGWVASVVNTITGARSKAAAKAVAMDQATPVEPASAPASSQPAASPPPAAKP